MQDEANITQTHLAAIAYNCGALDLVIIDVATVG
jgi:hypothetical protein